MDKKSIMVFGVGELQYSIILRAKAMGLFVVGIDPSKDACCQADVDAFEIVDGEDYEGTLAVARKYNISAIVTVATDKPLVMMARIAKVLQLRFFSEETAHWATDKYQMKQLFLQGKIPCARGRLIHNAAEAQELSFPVICKPRDNSGSRGVKYCKNVNELQECIDEALEYSRLDTVLVEEFIEGREFSIESLHYRGVSEVIQFTEKKTTKFPYNVELGHKQPANLTEAECNVIREIISRIALCMNFENCPSHTELKINEKGIFVIETSPRLGGDYITSILTPLSTGINLEDQLIHIALGEPIDTKTGRVDKAAGICFFSLPEGIVTSINPQIKEILSWPNIYHFQLKLGIGDKINKITSSINRYGQFIVVGDSRKNIDGLIENYEHKIREYISLIAAV